MIKGPDKKIKKVKFDEYYQNKRFEYVKRACRIQSDFNGRSVRQRPRDDLEEKLLLSLDKKRWQRMTESGELVKIGRRHWVLRIF